MLVKSKKLIRFLVFLILCVISFLFFLPFLWILLTSLKTTQEVYHVPLTILPKKLVFTQYTSIIAKLPQFLVYLKNSFIVTVFVVLCVTFLGSLGGYGFGRKAFKGSEFIMALIVFMMGLPWILYLIPIFVISAKLNLLDTRIVLIISYTGLFLPLAIFIMRGHFRSLPNDLEDAARIDGCSEFQIFLRVMMPLAKPGVATVAIFTFLFSWEEFLFALTLSPHFTTLAVGITYLKMEGMSWAYDVLSAVIIIGIAPTLVMFLVLRRHLIKGLLEGAIKG